jgi:DNA-binding response OmpR family regulator
MTNQTQSKKILCIEDEKDLRESISFYLNQKGFEIIEAANGEDGYNKYVESKPDIILCDINMPKMNGHQFLEKISNDFPEKVNQIPFIFLTALGQKNDFIKGMDLGADEYVVKPIDFEVLLSMINSKIAKSEFNKQETVKKLDQFCNQVSHLLPNEIKEPLDSIIKYSATLKKETFGAFIEPKYVTLASRIYISALKLNTQISKTFNKETIKKEVDNLKDIIDLNDFNKELVTIFSNQPIDFVCKATLPSLQGNLNQFKNAIIDYLTQQLKAEARDIVFDIFLDYEKNLIISVASYTALPIISDSLESMLLLHSGKFSTIDDDGKTHHLITLPNYLLK